MALLQYLQTNRDTVLAQTIQQVISNAGKGSLGDGNEASAEFREFLTLIPIEPIFTYFGQCLDNPFQKSGYVLQDLTNELGRRLDFDVENGLYQGRKNAIGFDGVWRFADEPELVVEVKTNRCVYLPARNHEQIPRRPARRRQDWSKRFDPDHCWARRYGRA